MRSTSTKKPLPRDSFSPFESNVSIATADGLMRRTSSGRRSCDASMGWGISRKSKIQTNFMSEKKFLHVSQPGHDVPDFNILALFCAPIEQLNHAIGDFFSNRDAVGNSNQIRIFELHTRAFVTVV